MMTTRLKAWEPSGQTTKGLQRVSIGGELASLIGRQVTVVTTGHDEYRGVLLAASADNLSVSLGDVQDSSGRRFYRIVLNGSIVAKIVVEKVLVDLRRLAERIERVFPKMVRLNEEAGVIIVMEKIRVDESGVIEGSGPAAERLEAIYKEFVHEQQT
jgi:small nuclear ribonucleoprotein (snRNP)-like protein